MQPLKNKSIIVTGASHGIGSALSLGLAQAGVNLVLNARNDSPLESVARECERIGASVHYVAGNAAHPEIAQELVDAALKSGSFYGFIHAAGVLTPGPLLWELTHDGLEEVLDASLIAGCELIRAAVPHLRREGQGGLAVFFGSGAAESNTPGIGAYCVAKAAEEHLARQLAFEAPEVTTLIYRPGVVETRMQKQARKAEGGAAETVRERFRGYKNHGDLITPEQAALALIDIISHNPRRFHGKVATWRDATNYT